MSTTIREQNFFTSLKKQIQLATASGGRPSLTAVIELAGGNYNHFGSLINKLSDLELRGLDYDLKKIGIDNRAIAGILEGPKPLSKQNVIPQNHDLIILESTNTIIKCLASHEESDRRRIMEIVDLFFYGHQLRFTKKDEVEPTNLSDFRQA